MNLYLVRHGETAWSKNGRHTGLTDLPLTEDGIQEAKDLGKRLKGHRFDKVFASPLKRALDTCTLAGFHPEISPDLVEWDYGDYEGLMHEEILKEDPHWNLFTKGAPGGESVADVALRADRILKIVQTYPGDVALFSSAHILRTIAARWLKLPPVDGKLLLLSTASVSVLGHERETPVIVSWNHTD